MPGLISTLVNDEEDGSLLALVTGRDLGDTKKRSSERLKLKLIDGKRYGSVTLNKSSTRGNKYACRCDCGRVVFLNYREILTKARMKVGCLSFHCPHGSPEVKAWGNAEYALKLQLGVLLRTAQEQVDPLWGGTAYDSRPVVGTKGFETLKESLLLVVRDEHWWWLARKNPVLPYAPFNILVQGVPSFDVFEGRAKYIMFRDRLYSLEEVERLFELDIRDVREWRKNIFDDNELMEKILEESQI